MSGSFEINSMDVGAVNIVPTVQPAVTTASNTGGVNGGPLPIFGSTQPTPSGVVGTPTNQPSGLVGGVRNVAAIMGWPRPVEYLVVVPPTKIDGVTATTGTITLSVQWLDRTGANVGAATSYGAYNLAGGGEQVVLLVPPSGADRFQVTHTLSGGAGAYGSYTAGVVLGAKTLNRTF